PRRPGRGTRPGGADRAGRGAGAGGRRVAVGPRGPAVVAATARDGPCGRGAGLLPRAFYSPVSQSALLPVPVHVTTEPLATSPATAGDGVDVAFLVDDSDSVGSASRQAEGWIRQAVGTRGGDDRAALAVFGAEGRLEYSLRDDPPTGGFATVVDGGATDIGSA